MIVVRDAIGPSEIGAVVIREATGSSDIGEVLVRDAVGLQLIYSPASGMSADVPPDAYGASASGSFVSISTNMVTVTVTGGTPGYSYSWAQIDGPDVAWRSTSPTSATTSFRRTSVGPGDSWSATFVCTVTDANGQTATSNPVTATVTNLGNIGAPLP